MFSAPVFFVLSEWPGLFPCISLAAARALGEGRNMAPALPAMDAVKDDDVTDQDAVPVERDAGANADAALFTDLPPLSPSCFG